MQIRNSSPQDIEEIFRLYRIASAYMVDRCPVVWPEFDRTMVETEIVENRQWKMILEDEVACIWATAYRDPLIWEEKDVDPAVYIHRIATNPNFRGQFFVQKIVDWAIDHAKEKDIKYVRLDTVGNNPRLIKHYTEAGFEFLGFKKLKNPADLPAHYHELPVALFELKLT